MIELAFIGFSKMTHLIEKCSEEFYDIWNIIYFDNFDVTRFVRCHIFACERHIWDWAQMKNVLLLLYIGHRGKYLRVCCMCVSLQCARSEERTCIEMNVNTSTGGCLNICEFTWSYTVKRRRSFNFITSSIARCLYLHFSMLFVLRALHRVCVLYNQQITHS